jgi:hypothetical protein
MNEGIDGRPDGDAIARTCLLTDLAVELGREDSLACALGWHEALEHKGIRGKQALTLDMSRANAIGGKRYGTKWQWEQPTLAPDTTRCACLNNLGKRLRVAGRVVEALDCWRRALELQPAFGMALCNRAGTLAAYAESLEDAGQKAFLLWEAHKEASAALAPTALYTHVRDELTREEAKTLKEWIESKVDVEGIEAADPSTWPGASATAEERDYRHWCLANCLYLNPLNDAGPQTIATIDST